MENEEQIYLVQDDTEYSEYLHPTNKMTAEEYEEYVKLIENSPRECSRKD